MIRFDQRNFDVQETERVFKKVIHPTHGHNSIRLVDKDGIPMRSPNSATLSRLHSSYVLTPRGVPARKCSHSYSGQIAKDKMHNLVNSMDTNSQEMASYTSMHNYGLSSAGSSRHYIPVNLSAKKRTFGSGPPRSVKPMAKSASSERSRLLTASPDENLLLDPDNEKWNGSPQGKRLEKEWVALSECRALKRSSEIVSHRVDRMYFMTGNKLKLQQKYHIEDDELQHLKDLSQARASSRTSRCHETKERRKSSGKRLEDEHDKRLEKIERKLSNIERRLSFIEESKEEEETLRLHFKEPAMDGHSPTCSSSSESGIQGDLQVDEDAMHHNALGRYLDPDHADAGSVLSGQSIDSEHTEQEPMSEWPLRKIEVTAIGGQKQNKKTDTGIHVWDILAHDKSMTGTETMINLLKMYPDIHERTRRAWEKSEFETANSLTLGVVRKVRQAKSKYPKKQKKSAYFPCNEVVSPSCNVCKLKAKDINTKPQSEYVPCSKKKDHTKQKFPVRKVRKTVRYSHPPVDCDCRQDPILSKGPLLTVQGTQLPLFDRGYLCCA